MYRFVTTLLGTFICAKVESHNKIKSISDVMENANTDLMSLGVRESLSFHLRKSFNCSNYKKKISSAENFNFDLFMQCGFAHIPQI
jgi:hypothetical protein